MRKTKVEIKEFDDRTVIELEGMTLTLLYYSNKGPLVIVEGKGVKEDFRFWKDNLSATLHVSLPDDNIVLR
ncbi:hypothetical protein DRJ17_04695 [Candidatus Woesearchaeota archaeon]|nr:MAG: hypothetical protein DRJ17_04695 [Candidatus Woesearchaeota archaeon]